MTPLDDDQAISYLGGREHRVALRVQGASGGGRLIAGLRSVGALPDPRHREALEGAIVRARITRFKDGKVEGFEYFLGVDDGRSPEVLVRSLGFERAGKGQKLSANPFHYLRNGDHVRIWVTPRSGQILEIEPLADAAGGVIPPIGTMPEESPGSPLTTQDVARRLQMAVRRTTSSQQSADGGAVQSFGFQLVNDPPGLVVVLVAAGADAVGAIELAAGAGEAIPVRAQRRVRMRYPAQAYRHLRNYSGRLIIASDPRRRYGSGHAAGVVWPPHLTPYAIQPGRVHEDLVNRAMDRLAKARKH